MQIKENDVVEVHFPSSSEFAHWNGMVVRIIEAPKPEMRKGSTEGFYPKIKVLRPSPHPSLIHYPRNTVGSEFTWRFPKFFRSHKDLYLSPFENKYV
jgi:hypothetical protein